jgi:hypothetical protein
LRVEPSTSTVVTAPRTLSDLPRDKPLRSGLGLLTVDLRRTELPASGAIPLEIDAGVRRTLVALPHDRCVHVMVLQSDMPAVLRVGAALLGESTQGQPGATLFGRGYAQGTVTDTGRRPGPTLRINFSSAGGELVVRDYPDDVNPDFQPDWPGYPVYVEERPDTTGTPRAAAKRLVRDWRARRKQQARSKERIDRLMGGPCTAKR